MSLQISDPEKVAQQKGEKLFCHTSDFSGKTILIVDDLELNLEVASMVLESMNVETVAASGGKEAVDLFAQNPERFDMILMDMQMPGTDGLQATRMIRESDIDRAASIPIVAMTANVFKDDIEKCLAAGMSDHLGKPIEISEIAKMLAKYLT